MKVPFEIEQKIYFGRGPMEFVGTVKAVEIDKIQVLGIETGCLAKTCSLVTISTCIKEPHQLHAISKEEFAERTKNEPAFTHVQN